ncbi:DUF2273 domain-containing protein [Clostridium sp. Cult3]|uniref:DUF2273 domain-containing protein n=1 Tax=Clostridium sp. Cult3 TaxID=2079004 RepID=UPI001F3C72EB|nr:DUF2273 domain-containing protein [Clostridium sp. Cult3]
MAREMFSKFIDWVRNHKGKFFGGILGFLIAILVLNIGFFKTLFIVLCTWAGYYLGSKSDSKENFKDLIDKIIPHNREQ